MTDNSEIQQTDWILQNIWIFECFINIKMGSYNQSLP